MNTPVGTKELSPGRPQNRPGQGGWCFEPLPTSPFLPSFFKQHGSPEEFQIHISEPQRAAWEGAAGREIRYAWPKGGAGRTAHIPP